jgi:hypothetical protein
MQFEGNILEERERQTVKNGVLVTRPPIVTVEIRLVKPHSLVGVYKSVGGTQ